MNRKFQKISLLILILLFTFFVVLYAVLNTQYARDYISHTIEGIVNSSIDQKFSIGKLRGNLFTGFEFRDIELLVEEQTFLRIDKISTNYSLPLLASVVLRGDIPLYNTKASGVQVNLIKDENGVWNFKKIKDSSDEDRSDQSDDSGKDKKLVNIYLKDTAITDSVLRIINRKNESEIDLNIDKSQFSVDLLGIHRKFVLDSKNINLRIEPFGINLESISADALITKDNAAFKNLDMKFNDINIQGQGIINDYSNPSFNINAYIGGFSPSDIGEINMYVKASGKSWDYKRFNAEAELSLLNSYIRGRRIWTDLDKIKLRETKAFIKGDINTEFGRASVDGFVDLQKILQNEGTNGFSFDTVLTDLRAAELFDILQIDTGKFTPSPDATFVSRFTASGKWKEVPDFSTSIDFTDLTITDGETEKLSLSGKTSVNSREISLDVQSSIRNLNLSDILKDIEIETDINTDIYMYGTIPFKGDFLSNIEVTTDSEVFPSTVDKVAIDQAVVDAEFRKGILNVDEFEMDSSDLKVSLEGSGSSQNGLDLAYTARSENLEFLDSFMKDLGISGSIQMDGTIIGDIKNPRITTVGKFEDLKFRDIFYGRSGDFNISGYINKKLEGLDLTSNLKNIMVSGKKVRSLQLLAEKEEENIVANITSIISDDRSLIASVSVSDINKEVRTLKFNSLEMNLDREQKITSTPFKVVVSSDRIDLDNPSFKYMDGYLSVSGYYGFNDSINITAELNNIDNSVFRLLTDSSVAFSGKTSGNVSVNGRISSPTLNANIKSENFGIAEYTLEDVRFSLDGKNNRIGIDLASAGAKTGSLQLKGDIGTDLNLKNIGDNIANSDLDLNLTASDFDISLFQHFVSELTSLTGRLNSELDINGNFNDPRITGTITAADSEIKLKSLANSFSVETLTVTGDRNSLDIKPSVIRSDEGEATLSGNINLSNLTYDISVEMDKLLVKPRFITANVSGKLGITGDDQNRIMIEGDIKTSNTKIVIVDSKVEESGEIKFVDESEEPEEFILSDDEDDSFYISNVALDLGINVPRDSWVKGKGANIEITGDIDIDKQYGQSHNITGSIDVVRGQYIVFGKLFKIEDGSITFPADGSLTPLLNMNVSYNVSNVVVYINVRGKADKPKLDLSSSPPMEESDIISYVLFGTSRNNLGSEQRNVAGEIASSIAAGEVANFIGGRFGLDVLSVQGGEEGGLSDPQIRAGSYINPDIYIGYERSSTSYPGSENTTNNNFILEWKINESFSLESQVGGENSGVDIFYNFNF